MIKCISMLAMVCGMLPSSPTQAGVRHARHHRIVIHHRYVRSNDLRKLRLDKAGNFERMNNPVLYQYAVGNAVADSMSGSYPIIYDRSCK